jgi:alkyl hydroperoxide reductase subunit AhpC
MWLAASPVRAATAVIVFYRGVWCPYCNLTLRAYRDQLHSALTEGGVRLIAVSPQKADGSLTTQEKNDLRFPFLSDAGNALASQLGILLSARTPELRDAQEKLGTDLHDVNADGTEKLPMPTVVLIDAESTMRWIDIHPGLHHTHRSHRHPRRRGLCLQLTAVCPTASPRGERADPATDAPKAMQHIL